ncbi:hypothetical protein DFR44_11615 [Hydromonas duriensis]|uniref:Uncharacterized protein n=1 Tax=Hydromonas duriensis TaxID=1527608 RepID=A0A4R6Y736_9BURK|nr:hypothetical protein DFR44_11615 [Hydromonas duriensis]
MCRIFDEKNLIKQKNVLFNKTFFIITTDYKLTALNPAVYNNFDASRRAECARHTHQIIVAPNNHAQPDQMP